MANKWSIPKDTEDFVIKRDSACVYCGVNFAMKHESRKTKPTWEHIVNDIRLTSTSNISLCCTSCNASKGVKSLEDWLRSSYCLSKGITKYTVSEVIKKAIENPPKLNTKE